QERQPRVPDPFSRGSWQMEVSLGGALEAWNYNGSREELSALVPGIAYGLGKGVAIVVRGMLSYVGQRGPDGFLLGALIGARGRIYRGPRWTVFWEGDVGVAQADTLVPRRGTRFNYLAQGGLGVTVRLRDDLHVVSGLRLLHISNGGLAGRDRNPDIEAIGPHVGVLIGF
ncbi:MAG TPA: acyloxyacyl hydrolase, partial [Vicinamibacterales bacterium]|nr:acyloxyacyl hydrolase [Vicinamibacterales bacterium]